MVEHWPGDDEPKPAPPPLRQIQALLNTVERPDGADRLADPADAGRWLLANRLLSRSAVLTTNDLALVTEVREAIRALLVHNGGGPAPLRESLAPLQRIATVAVIRPAVEDDGQVALQSVGDDVASRLAGLLPVIRDAQRDGTWALLKVCGNDECRWAFYDSSRNHTGMWCDMATCGNKLKNRQLRARQRNAKSVRTDATPERRPARPSR